MRAAIYHFTDKSAKRPIVYQKQLTALKEFAESKGFDDVDIYCDKSLRRTEHKEFDRFMSSCSEYEALITKDFYHISRNTQQSMKIMKDLLNKNVPVYSMENGRFFWEEVPVDQPLRVATYTTHFGEPHEIKQVVEVRNDIFKLYANKRTSWIITDQYYDETLYKKDAEQIQLKKLIANKDLYDLLLVHNLGDVHWRTAKFCKIREQLQLDIYSLQNGFLKYTTEVP
ncbi:site-specific recombinase [Clostridium sp. SY8519]|uniref:recombinase family protein n=1 Tax=Clostridium sp. (strain SY8519) TaxID=1042156 RepID=UPI0002172034|nr:recombinase family protein [Clostridium sp. SY8519]BAK46759.1 site-specific recombinase [Clostridium sp. SY8519]